MRIVGGQWRGRALFGPKDDRVRPTSDKVRESIFNILAHRDFEGFSLEGARVLDLFAGTGAFGLEALSRGAAFALFVDDHAESRAIIRRNVEALNATGVTKIWRRDATKMGERPGNAGPPFDLIFADPPYRRGLGPLAIESALSGGWVAESPVILLEVEASQASLELAGMVRIDCRAYGETQVALFRRPDS